MLVVFPCKVWYTVKVFFWERSVGMKKIQLCLCCLLVALVLSFGWGQALANTNFSIYAGTGTATAGSLVQIPVGIISNPGIVSVKVTVTYDTSCFTLVEREGVDFSGVVFSPPENSTLVLN